MDPDQTTSFFDQIPDTYGGDPVAVAEPPANPSKPSDESPEVEEKSSTPDLLAPKKGEGDDAESEAPKKTAAQYAAERREAKAKRNELLEKAPALEEENRALREKFEASQKKLADLESLASKDREEVATAAEDIETLKARVKTAEERYIASHAPKIDPHHDEEVQRHMSEIEGALRANLPRMANDAKGERVRLDINLARKDPARRGAIDAAVKDYALAAASSDATAMDRAVIVLGSALGNLDLEDDGLRDSLDAALAAASEPFQKGVARFRYVQENAAAMAQQRRVHAIAETEARLMQPLRLDPKAIDDALEADPSHPWANFGKLISEMPDEFRAAVEEEVRRDAAVLGAMAFQPPPLASNATAADIERHEALTRASSARAIEAAQYLAVGRAVMDGGILAHLRAEVASAKSRLDEVGESLSIPNRGGSHKDDTKTTPGIWDAVPSNYGR